MLGNSVTCEPCFLSPSTAPIVHFTIINLPTFIMQGVIHMMISHVISGAPSARCSYLISVFIKTVPQLIFCILQFSGDHTLFQLISGPCYHSTNSPTCLGITSPRLPQFQLYLPEWHLCTLELHQRHRQLRVMITKGNQAAHQMDRETSQLIHHNGANRKQYARMFAFSV